MEDRNASEFYQAHLDRVSRSFAFCISQLQEPLRHWISLSYLLCRVLDTIEDSLWPTEAMQKQAYVVFDLALSGVEPPQSLSFFADESQASTAEQDLLIASKALFSDLRALPPGVSEIVRSSVSTMSQGMQYFSERRKKGQLYLKNLSEVNQYCFFVAGVVGELLAKLLSQVTQVPLAQSSLLKAHHFGLFLQKVNLLKDQVGDERQGRHLIPSRQLVEDSAQENATHAFQFLQELPSEQTEFRRFCAWSLFLGLESLLVARKSQQEGSVLKVGRQRTEQILSDVESALDDAGRMSSLFRVAAVALGWTHVTSVRASTNSAPLWLTHLYRGPLSAQSLSALGV